MSFVDYCEARGGTLEKWKTPDTVWSVIPELCSSSFIVKTTNKAWFYDKPKYYRLSTGIIQIAVSLRKQTEIGLSNEEYDKLCSCFQYSEPRFYANLGIKTSISFNEVISQTPEYDFQKVKFECEDDNYFFPINFDALSDFQLEKLVASHSLAKGEHRYDPGRVRSCFFVKQMETPTWVFAYRIYTKATSLTNLSLQLSFEFITDPSRRRPEKQVPITFSCEDFYSLGLFNTRIFFPPMEVLARPYLCTKKRKHHPSTVEKLKKMDDEEENEEEEEPKRKRRKIEDPTEEEETYFSCTRPVEKMLLFELKGEVQEMQSQLREMHENYWRLLKEQNANFQKIMRQIEFQLSKTETKIELIDSHCRTTQVFFESMTAGLGRMNKEMIQTQQNLYFVPPPSFENIEKEEKEGVNFETDFLPPPSN